MSDSSEVLAGWKPSDEIDEHRGEANDNGGNVSFDLQDSWNWTFNCSELEKKFEITDFENIFFQWRRVTGEGQFMTNVKVILIKRELPTLWYRLGQNFVSAPKLHNYFESHWSLVSSLTYALMNFIQLLSGGSLFLVLINVIGHDWNYSTIWDKYLGRPNFLKKKTWM